jgi:hypothetical protein
MNQIRLTAWTIAAACAAALAACAENVGRDDGYVDTGVVYPERVHYYDPAWPDYVYYYDGPDVVVRRRVFVEDDGHRYYYDDDHGGRRLRYDHEKALRTPPPERARRR